MIKTRTKRTFGMLFLSIIGIIGLLIPTVASAWGWHHIGTPRRGGWFNENVYTSASVEAVGHRIQNVYLFVALQKWNGSSWVIVRSTVEEAEQLYPLGTNILEAETTAYWSTKGYFRTYSYAEWYEEDQPPGEGYFTSYAYSFYVHI